MIVCLYGANVEGVLVKPITSESVADHPGTATTSATIAKIIATDDFFIRNLLKTLRVNESMEISLLAVSLPGGGRENPASYRQEG